MVSPYFKRRAGPPVINYSSRFCLTGKTLSASGNAELKDMNPPDDFFSSHSDLKEFIKLTLLFDKQSEAAESKKGRKNRAQPDIALAGAARQAFDRAKRDMPFLSYELNDALGAVPATPLAVFDRSPQQLGQPPRPDTRPPNMRPRAKKEGQGDHQNHSDKSCISIT